MGSTHDPLSITQKRIRGCAQCFRQLGRREFELRDLEKVLSSATGCGGHGCDDCADAVLRLCDYIGAEGGYSQALQLAKWAKCYVGDLSPDYQLRAACLIAFFQRYADPSAAALQLAATTALLDRASAAERAHHLARSAIILTESLLFDEARQSVKRSCSLYKDSAPADPERGPAWAAVAETYVEIGAAYMDAGARFSEPLENGLAALAQISESAAPRTYHALTVNILSLIVSAWRSGVSAIDPACVLSQIEESFDFRSRRSDTAATSMRWLWVIVASHGEGLSQKVRNRLRHTRAGLIAQRRWRDLLFLELDVLWAACYHHRHRPLRSHLLSQAKNLRRALCEVGEDLSPLDNLEKAAKAEPYLRREQLQPLFDLRGIRMTQIRDIHFR